MDENYFKKWKLEGWESEEVGQSILGDWGPGMEVRKYEVYLSYEQELGLAGTWTWEANKWDDTGHFH